MRRVCLAAVLTALAAGQVIAQPAPKHPRSAETPLDVGPFTPEANRAYQGGGMILQGAPGAPAPIPEGTPPGQTPRNMVPLK